MDTYKTGSSSSYNPELLLHSCGEAESAAFWKESAGFQSNLGIHHPPGWRCY